MHKIRRLGYAVNIEARKRVPAIIIVTAVIYLVFFGSLFLKTVSNAQSASDNSVTMKAILVRLEKLGRQNKDLQLQNKALQEQNNLLAQQARDQGTCFVKAFAIYTQTQQPVSFDEIEHCNIVVAQSAPASTRPPGSTSTPNNNKNVPTTPNQNPTNSQNNGGSGNTNNGSGGNKNHDPKKVVGIPACLPGSLSFISNGLCVTN